MGFKHSFYNKFTVIYLYIVNICQFGMSFKDKKIYNWIISIIIYEGILRVFYINILMQLQSIGSNPRFLPIDTYTKLYNF